MSTNWAQLRQELKVITKQTSPAAASPAGGTRKRKMMVGTENKWKKARAEVVAASKSVQGTAAALSAVGPTTTNILALDCEYVGTGIGGVDDMLARVSIVNVDGDPIYDKYVRPTEEVVDYRTLVSGIRPGHLLRGISFSQVQSEVKKLLSDNIVIGHALHNDFKVLAITHPPKLIRDTAKCKLLRETLENPKKTPSLKLLAHHLLGVQIQQGEHDSVMDAKIALRIYLQYRGRWEKSGSKAKAQQQHKKKRK